MIYAKFLLSFFWALGLEGSIQHCMFEFFLKSANKQGCKTFQTTAAKKKKADSDFDSEDDFKPKKKVGYNSFND